MCHKQTPEWPWACCLVARKRHSGLFILGNKVSLLLFITMNSSLMTSSHMTPGGQVSGNTQLSWNILGSGYPRIASDCTVVLYPEQGLCSTRLVNSDLAVHGAVHVLSVRLHTYQLEYWYRLTASMAMDEG